MNKYRHIQISKNLVLMFSSLFLVLVAFSFSGTAQEENPEPAIIPFDLFEDNQYQINAPDMFLFAQEWGKQLSEQSPSIDFDGNQQVNKIDLLLFLSNFHSLVSTPTPLNTPTPIGVTETPTPLQTSTPTLTPSPTIQPATPTPVATDTPLPEETPTPAATSTPEITDTPTPEETPTTGATATPADTETPLPEETPTISSTSTPTDTPLPEPTDTPTPIVIEPTSTPVPDETDTPLPSPTETETPLPEETPTTAPTDSPTPQPTPEGTVTATPTPGFDEFFVNFDSLDALPGGGLDTLDAENEDELINQGRMPFNNFAIPWFIFNANEDNPSGFGVALSQPKSAALNTDFGRYSNLQTSILEIEQEFNTVVAKTPKLEFDVAFDIETPFGTINDFLIVEVLRAGQTDYELVDINDDGEIVSDREALGETLTDGTFDGLFGTSNSADQQGEPLGTEDFIHLEVNLPRSEALRIAFRFESDVSSTGEGVYLDNIRVFDDVGDIPNAPQIRTIQGLNNQSLYVDTRNPILIQGNFLTPAESVTFSSRDGSADLPFTTSDNGITVTLPRLTEPNQSESAAIQINRTDGVSSPPFTVAMEAAPTPLIEAVDPAPFFLEASNATLNIMGSHFRSALNEEDTIGGSIVILQQTSEDQQEITEQVYLDSAFVLRSQSELIFNATRISEFNEGFVNVIVRNQYSGNESEPFQLFLQPGTGELDIDAFEIQMGSGFNAQFFDPETDILPLQTDQAFILWWDGSGFEQSLLNVDIAGTPVLVNGEPIESIEEGKIGFIFAEFSVGLAFAPNVIPVTGEITASIRMGNGAPTSNTFPMKDPLPPILYQREDDWSSMTLSASQDYFSTDIYVYGDNFRGQTNENLTNAEPVSELYLIPVDGGDPIQLPPITERFNVNIQPEIADDFATEDILNPYIPADTVTVPEGETKEFRLRVVNPDSGLFADSEATVTFEP